MGLGVLAALLLHGLLLGIPRHKILLPEPGRPALDVRWLTIPAMPDSEARLAVQPAPVSRDGAAPRRAAAVEAPPLASPRLPGSPAPVAGVPAADAPGDGAPAVPSGIELMESARRIAREAARSGPGRGEVVQGTVLERPALAPLARALTRRAASEQRLQDGTIRGMDAWGREYCLRPPPDFARGGPVEPMAVPTTCP